jgi:hypothetical protein
VPTLRRMKEEHQAIRMVRSIPGSDRLDGYVVGLGRRWLLLARLPDVRIDGYVAVRIRDIQRMQVAPCNEVSSKLLRATEIWPPAGPTTPIGLDHTSELIQTAYANAGLVIVQVEYVNPDIAFIGSPVHESRNSMVLHELTPKGVWDGSLSRWRYEEITRVEFSGTYESDLPAVAGPGPARQIFA